MPDFTWRTFAELTKDSAHWPLMERGAELVGHPGYALDLGFGGGRDTRYLLAHGWHVTAVEREPAAVAMISKLKDDKLRVVQSSFQDFDFGNEAFDLVNAQFTLPFVPRASSADVFTRIKQALKPGGIFAGQFFGVHDEWNTPDNDMTFLTREEVSEFLRDMDVVEVIEEEREGGMATGGTKYWHVFHVLARKISG